MKSAEAAPRCAWNPGKSWGLFQETRGGFGRNDFEVQTSAAVGPPAVSPSACTCTGLGPREREPLSRLLPAPAGSLKVAAVAALSGVLRAAVPRCESSDGIAKRMGVFPRKSAALR